MSGADLFEDGFPHGTVRGYELGCRGSGCPAKVEYGQSCREANIRTASDWGYRKRVQAGASLEEQRVPESFVEAAPATRTKRSRAATLPSAPLMSPPTPNLDPDELPRPAAPSAGPGTTEQPERTPEPPHGKRVLDDAVRTLAESLELQRALADIGERALRTIRIEITHLRRDDAAQSNQQEQ